MRGYTGKEHLPRTHRPEIPNKAKIVAGVTLAVAGAGAGAYIADQAGAFHSGPDHVQKVNLPAQPTEIPGTNIVNPLKTVTSTPTATPETPTATPTPEKPKTVEWSADQITAAQQAGLAEGKILFADTWSEDGGKAQIAKNSTNRAFIMLDFEDTAKVKDFSSPVSGKVTGIAKTPSANTWAIFIQAGNIEIEISADLSNRVLIKDAQEINVGDPIMEMSGIRISPSANLSKRGQILIGDVTNFSNSLDNILHDENGATVTLAK